MIQTSSAHLAIVVFSLRSGETEAQSEDVVYPGSLHLLAACLVAVTETRKPDQIA